MRVQRRLDRTDAPLHYEAVDLRPGWRLLGWPAAAVGAVAGVVLAASAAVAVLEVAGVVLAGSCGAVLVGLVRCRRFSTVVGRRLVTAGAGPLTRRAPVALVDDLEVRGATSWRRLYADREVVIRLRVGDRPLIVPSREPEELVAAVRALQND